MSCKKRNRRSGRERERESFVCAEKEKDREREREDTERHRASERPTDSNRDKENEGERERERGYTQHSTMLMQTFLCRHTIGLYTCTRVARMQVRLSVPLSLSISLSGFVFLFLDFRTQGSNSEFKLCGCDRFARCPRGKTNCVAGLHMVLVAFEGNVHVRKTDLHVHACGSHCARVCGKAHVA